MVKIFKIIICTVIFTMLLSTLIVFAQATPKIIVEQINADAGGSVSVPIRIENNTGICGATVAVEYDKSLVLTAVEKGTALTALTMTNPGKLSANPINIGWDGMDADASNGVIAILTFTVPDISGTYNINISYEDGDIVDGNLQPISLKMNKGQITVGFVSEVTVKVDGKGATMRNDSGDSGKILVAFYGEYGKLLSLESYLPQSEPIKVDNIESASYAKVMCWSDLSMLKPLCEAQIIDLE